MSSCGPCPGCGSNRTQKVKNPNSPYKKECNGCGRKYDRKENQ